MPAIFHQSKLSLPHDWKCSICSKEFLSKQERGLHSKVDHGGKKLKCSKCGQDFTRAKGFNRHIRKNRCEKNLANSAKILLEQSTISIKSTVPMPMRQSIKCLTQEQLTQVYNQLNMSPDTNIVDNLYSRDLETFDLNGRTKGWLNDEVINNFLAMVANSQKNSLLAFSTIAMSTYFFKSLKENGYKPRWTRKLDLFSQRKILIPINLDGAHWVLAVIDMVEKCISFYDSFASQGQEIFNTLIDFLEKESLDKKGLNLDRSAWTQQDVIKKRVQTNYTDCGLWLLMHAHYVCNNMSLRFQESQMPLIRARTPWCIMNKTLLFP